MRSRTYIEGVHFGAKPEDPRFECRIHEDTLHLALILRENEIEESSWK